MNTTKMQLDEFTTKYKPTDAIIANDELVKRYSEKVPSALIELWKTKGFGKYNDGIIEIVNPEDFKGDLERTLGKEVPNYVPIAIGAFGDLFYYRKLSDTEEDVCLFDPHFRKIHVCCWSLTEFFNAFLCDEEIINRNLSKALFEAATKKLGKLKNGEIFFFTPALALGGTPTIEYVDKGNCHVHLEILFQL
jgi:hypothetical protein